MLLHDTFSSDLICPTDDLALGKPCILYLCVVSSFCQGTSLRMSRLLLRPKSYHILPGQVVCLCVVPSLCHPMETSTDASAGATCGAGISLPVQCSKHTLHASGLHDISAVLLLVSAPALDGRPEP